MATVGLWQFFYVGAIWTSDSEESFTDIVVDVQYIWLHIAIRYQIKPFKDPSDSTQKFEVTIRQIRKDSLLSDFLHPGLTVHPGCPPPVYSECDLNFPDSTCNESEVNNTKKGQWALFQYFILFHLHNKSFLFRWQFHWLAFSMALLHNNLEHNASPF